MSDQHPRPWRVGGFNGANWLCDAKGEVIKTIGVNDQFGPTLDLIAAAVNAYSPWISVEDRLPESSRRPALVMLRNGLQDIARCGPDEWGWNNPYRGCHLDVTHWTPLPEPPSTCPRCRGCRYVDDSATGMVIPCPECNKGPHPEIKSITAGFPTDWPVKLNVGEIPSA